MNPWKRKEVIGNAVLYLGDCLEILPTLPKVDAVITDPPYGVTACGWDVVADMGKLWALLELCTSDDSPLVFTAQQPFTTDLIGSRRDWFRHSWVWNKKFAGCFATCNQQPMKVHEDILVFGRKGVFYDPQKSRRMEVIKLGGKQRSITSPLASELPASKIYDEKYPISIIELSNRSEERGDHPTQKPVGLMQYLVKTYSKNCGYVLDPFMGSGSTGAAAVIEGRKFIGIEIEPKYFDIACERITNAQRQERLFS